MNQKSSHLSDVKLPTDDRKKRKGFSWWHNRRFSRHRNSFTKRFWKRKIFFILITVLFLFGVMYAQAAAPIREFVNQITTPKPKPITQSSKVLPSGIQQEIQTLAGQQIKEAQARSLLVTGSSNGANSVVSNSYSIWSEKPTIFQSSKETFQYVFTRNSATRAKITFRRIDRKIAELSNLLIQDKSDPAVQKAVAGIKDIGEQIGKIATNPSLQTDREILGLQIEQYNRLQLILQKIEDRLPMGAYLPIEEARVNYLVKGAQASLNAAPNLDLTHNVALKEVAKAVGKDFAELKAIEILTDMGAGLSPQTQEKLTGLEKELAATFEKRMLELPGEVRNRKLQEFIALSYGNPINRVRAFNQMQTFLTDREIILGIESLKELALKRVESRLFELTTPELEGKFNVTVLTDPADIKILIQAQMDIEAGKDPQKIAIIQGLSERGQKSAVEIFGKDKNILLGAFSVNPHPTILDLILVSRVQKVLNTAPTVSPEVKQAVTTVKQQTLQTFIKNIDQQGFATQSKLGYNPVSENADVRLLLAAPQTLTVLKEIKNDLSRKDKIKIAIAEKAASRLIKDHLLVQVQEPAIFKQYQDYIASNISVKEVLQKNAGSALFSDLTKKEKILEREAKKDEQQLYEKMQQITQNIFIRGEKGGGEVALENQLSQVAQQEIEQLKKELPERAVPKLETPDGVELPEVAKLPLEVEQAIIQAAENQIKAEHQSADVKLDLSLQAKDLGIAEPSILPGSIFYPVKELINTVELVLTFDPIAKAEKLVEQANEKTLEAATLVQEDQSQQTIDKSLEVLRGVQDDFVKLKAHTSDLADLREKEPEKIDKLVDTIINNGVARQTVLSYIEDKVYGDAYVAVEQVRQDVLKEGVSSLLVLTNNDREKLVQKLEAAVGEQQGSEFKEIKAVELLTEIERTQPQEAKPILDASEERLALTLENKLDQLPIQERREKLLDYAESLPGNPVRQLETYEQLKDSFQHTENILLTEALKDKAVENLIDRISEITDANTRQEFVDTVVGNQPQDLKIITEIEFRVDVPETIAGTETTPSEQKIADIKANVEQNIIDAYKDDAKAIAETGFFSDPTFTKTPDIVDVEVAKELGTILERVPEVSPEVVQVVNNLENKISDQFIENIANTTTSVVSGETVLSVQAAQTLQPIPAVIEELVALKEDTPASVDVKIDGALAVQVALMQEHITTEVNDLQTFQTYTVQITDNPIVAEVVAQEGGTAFTKAVEAKKQELEKIAVTDQTTTVSTVTHVQQEIFSAPVYAPSIIEQALPEVIQEQIKEIKKDIPTEQIPEVVVTATISITLPAPEPIAPTVQPAPPPAVVPKPVIAPPGL